MRPGQVRVVVTHDGSGQLQRFQDPPLDAVNTSATRSVSVRSRRSWMPPYEYTHSRFSGGCGSTSRRNRETSLV